MELIFDPGLALYCPLYRLDSHSFMTKDTHGHLCTVTGAVWGTQGRKFDGVVDYIDCGNAQVLNAEDFSVIAWVNFNTLQDACDTILSKSGIGADFELLAWPETDRVRFYFSSSGGSPPLESAAALMEKVWYNIAVIRSGIYAVMYINGMYSTSSSSYIGTRITNSNNFRIGNSAVHSGREINGSVGEVLFFSRPLTPGEILDSYIATKWRYR